MEKKVKELEDILKHLKIIGNDYTIKPEMAFAVSMTELAALSALEIAKNMNDATRVTAFNEAYYACKTCIKRILKIYRSES